MSKKNLQKIIDERKLKKGKTVLYFSYDEEALKETGNMYPNIEMLDVYDIENNKELEIDITDLISINLQGLTSLLYMLKNNTKDNKIEKMCLEIADIIVSIRNEDAEELITKMNKYLGRELNDKK